MIIISQTKEIYSQPDPSGEGAPDTTEERMQIRFVINGAIYKAPFPVPPVDYSAWNDANWKTHILNTWPKIESEIGGFPQYIDNSVDIDEAWASALIAIFKLTDTQRKNLTKPQIINYLKTVL